MIDVTSVSSHAEATVTIGVTGTPVLVATYQTRSFQPDQITVKFRYKPQTDADGWTHHTWTRTSVTVVGPRILKPAKDGTQRLGADHLRYHPMYADQLPEWLTKLVDELRPSGDIALAGA